MYNLDSLKLEVEGMEDHGSCITKSLGIENFRVLGKGGFGFHLRWDHKLPVWSLVINATFVACGAEFTI